VLVSYARIKSLNFDEDEKEKKKKKGSGGGGGIDYLIFFCLLILSRVSIFKVAKKSL